MTFTFTSPVPSFSLSSSPLTPHVLERGGGLGDKAAFIDGQTGRSLTYTEFEDAVRRQAAGGSNVGWRRARSSR
jgi:hypothetical protein